MYNLVGVMQYHIVVLICTSLLISDVEHLLLIGHLYIFFGEMSFSLAHFLLASVVFLLLSCKISM